MTCTCPTCGQTMKTEPATGMTPQQAKLLRIIAAYQRQHRGVSPSVREMAAAMGHKSVGSVHRIVTSLEERGIISRSPDRARSIVIRKAVA